LLLVVARQTVSAKKLYFSPGPMQKSSSISSKEELYAAQFEYKMKF